MAKRRMAFTSPSGTANFHVSDDGIELILISETDTSYVWLDERDGEHGMKLAGTANTTVRVTTDGFATLATLAATLPRSHNNACLRTRTGVYLVGLINLSGVGVQVARSADGGASWSTVTVDTTVAGSSRVFPTSFVECEDGSILVHRDPNAAAHDHVRVYRSTDDGATWTTVLDPIEANSGGLGAISYIRGRVFLVTGDGVHNLIVHRSVDEGVSWSKVLDAGTRRLFDASQKVRSAICLRPDGARMYVYTHSNPGGERYFSANNGATWTLETDPFGVQAIRSIHASAQRLWSVRDISGPTLLRSNDDGKTWTNLGAIKVPSAIFASYQYLAPTLSPTSPRLNYAKAGGAFVRWYDSLKAVAVGFPTGESEVNNQILWYFVGQGWVEDSRGWRDLLPLGVSDALTQAYAWDKDQGILREVDVDRVYTDDGSDVEAAIDTGYVSSSVKDGFVDDRVARWSWMSIVTSQDVDVRVLADTDNERQTDAFSARTNEDNRLNLIGRRGRLVMTFTLRNFFRLSEIIMRVVKVRGFRPRGRYD